MKWARFSLGYLSGFSILSEARCVAKGMYPVMQPFQLVKEVQPKLSVRVHPMESRHGATEQGYDRNHSPDEVQIPGRYLLEGVEQNAECLQEEH